MTSPTSHSPRPKALDRVRVTASTIAHDTNLARLVDAFRAGEMRRDAIETLLDMSPSGARKYIQDLRESRIIDLDHYDDPTKFSKGHPVYRLTASDEATTAFLASLIGRQTGANLSELRDAKDETRHVHMLRDDTGHAIKPAARKIPPRDPLMCALYGVAK